MLVEAGAAVRAPRCGVLAGADALPAVFHCAAGKDRTGLLVAMLVLGALGVGHDDIVEDYALTSATMERVPRPRCGGSDAEAAAGASPTRRRSFFAADPAGDVARHRRPRGGPRLGPRVRPQRSASATTHLRRARGSLLDGREPRPAGCEGGRHVPQHHDVAWAGARGATAEEIEAAARQYVRKVSGVHVDVRSHAGSVRPRRAPRDRGHDRPAALVAAACRQPPTTVPPLRRVRSTA